MENLFLYSVSDKKRSELELNAYRIQFMVIRK